MEVDSETQLKQSDTFNFEDADVIFQSSDGVLFHVHIANLVFGSEGFPPATQIKPEQDETVDLPEDSKILELLFRFVYPRLLPDIDELEFDALAQLAEAVEKYQVYVGRKQCSLFMARHVEKHPLAVLSYAIKHNYPALANSAAPNIRLSHMRSMERTAGVSYELLALWIPYYYRWTEAVRKTTERYTIIQPKGSNIFSAKRKFREPYYHDDHRFQQCTRWPVHQKNILAALATVPGPDWTIWREIANCNIPGP